VPQRSGVDPRIKTNDTNLPYEKLGIEKPFCNGIIEMREEKTVGRIPFANAAEDRRWTRDGKRTKDVGRSSEMHGREFFILHFSSSLYSYIS